MKLSDYMRQAAHAEQMARNMYRELMPAYPKPHFRRDPCGWGFRCTISVGDEFITAWGETPIQALNRATNMGSVQHWPKRRRHA